MPQDKQSEAMNAYSREEQEVVGDYDNYADRWIIQNVESQFGEGKRNTHRGNILKTIGGIFSKIGFKFATSGGDQGKVKDLKTENK